MSDRQEYQLDPRTRKMLARIYAAARYALLDFETIGQGLPLDDFAYLCDLIVPIETEYKRHCKPHKKNGKDDVKSDQPFNYDKFFRRWQDHVHSRTTHKDALGEKVIVITPEQAYEAFHALMREYDNNYPFGL